MKTLLCSALTLLLASFCTVAQTSSSSVPPLAPTPIGSPTPTAGTDLTPSQLSGVVTISGKAGSGTGFFCRLHDKIFVLTNQHVLAGLSDASIKTQTGGTVSIKESYVADSADLALLVPASVPEGVTPFDLLEKPEMNARKDDPILIPGNSKGDGVITQTPGKLVAIGPQRMETDNPVYPGNSGSPIIHIPTGKVIAVLTEAELISLNEFEKASFRSKQSAIKSEVRYFGHRVDTVSKWLPLNWQYFQATDLLVSQSREELNFLAAYFTDSSDTYKHFKELHEARNRAASLWGSVKHSDADKVEALKRFLRDVEALARRTQRRLEGRQFSYIHQRQVEDINALAKALQGGVDVARRDTDLVVILIQRGN